MAYQRFEHRKFARGQRQLLAIFLQDAQPQIKRKGTKGDHFLILRWCTWHFTGGTAAQHRVDSGQQLARVEWLGQIVVGTHLQPHDTVNVLAFGGQHDDGSFVIGGPQPATNGQAVLAGHHQVQHNQIDGIAQQNAVERLAVFGQDDLKTFLRQVTTQQVTNSGVIVNDDDFIGAWGGGSLSHGHPIICNRFIWRAEN